MIGSYDLEVLTPPCDPASPRLVAKAHLADDIAAVLPYLNAILPDASYWPEAKSLTCKDDGHSIAFHAREIAVADIADGADAERLIARLVDLVNHTWRRCAEIVPSVATRRRATPMAVYELLPGTNCKECGLAGCWQFALKLVTGEVRTGDCPSLTQPGSASELSTLRDLVAESA